MNHVVALSGGKDATGDRWWCRECLWSGARDQCLTRYGLLECPRCLPRGVVGVLLSLPIGITVTEARALYRAHVEELVEEFAP